jgi:hypothetical protein
MMQKKSVVAILDVGKTNKKLLLFDEAYNLVYEKSFLLATPLITNKSKFLL